MLHYKGVDHFSTKGGLLKRPPCLLLTKGRSKSATCETPMQPNFRRTERSSCGPQDLLHSSKKASWQRLWLLQREPKLFEAQVDGAPCFANEYLVSIHLEVLVLQKHPWLRHLANMSLPD